MNKDELLRSVKELAEQKLITKEELDEAFHSVQKTSKKRISTVEILYYIGGGVVALGIAILISQNWTDLSSLTKILATLGSGIAAYIVAVLLGQREKLEKVSYAFYLISALVLPIGLAVTFDIAGFDLGDYGIQSIASLILFLTFFSSYLLQKKNNVLLLFSIIFATMLYYSFMAFIFGKSPVWETRFAYLTIGAGLSYCFLGHAFLKSSAKVLTKSLYNFGILFVLGATMFLGGWEAETTMEIIWQAAFPFIAFGAIYLSVFLKSRAFLIWGTLFLMGYILKVSSVYFSDSLGWPLALVIAGLLMILLGYSSVTFRKKYLK
jgi:hypothetical protein